MRHRSQVILTNWILTITFFFRKFPKMRHVVRQPFPSLPSSSPCHWVKSPQFIWKYGNRICLDLQVMCSDWLNYEWLDGNPNLGCYVAFLTDSTLYSAIYYHVTFSRPRYKLEFWYIVSDMDTFFVISFKSYFLEDLCYRTANIIQNCLISLRHSLWWLWMT